MHTSKQAGLTLLEVLIALAVIAIALTAIIKVTTENIRGNIHLREKTTATWLALNILNKARLDLIQLPEAPDSEEGSEMVLNKSWQWQGFSQKTANAHIRELHVKIFHPTEHRLITELTSYTYAD